ncbi:MAG: Trm112 family protein [Candidatus Baldrarchaeia archaeon]
MEIAEGVLQCQKCRRWYPIIEGIPRMLPDNLRKKDEDLKFLERNKGRLLNEIIRQGRPYHLKTSIINISETFKYCFPLTQVLNTRSIFIH